jgi:hypothetical protein
MKFTTIIIGLIVVSAIIGGINSSHKSSGSGQAASSFRVVSPSSSGGPSDVRIVHGVNSDNSCTEEDGEARIYVTITLHNTASVPVTINPWATFDYSDSGSSTESYDTNWGHDFRIPAGAIRDASFYHTFNPQQHSMIRCAGFVDLGTDAPGLYLPTS